MKIELITNLQRQASKILADLHESKKAALVTERGQLSACLVGVQDYKFMQRRLTLLAGLSMGERAILEGRTTSHSEAKVRMQEWLK